MRTRQEQTTDKLTDALDSLRDEIRGPYNATNVDMLGTMALAARMVATYAENLRDILSGGGSADNITLTLDADHAAAVAFVLKNFVKPEARRAHGRAIAHIADELERHVPFGQRIRA